MALDQVLSEEVGAGLRKPTLRIWEWNEPGVVIERMKTTFTPLYGSTPDEVTSHELARAEQLVIEKFGTEEWLQRVP